MGFKAKAGGRLGVREKESQQMSGEGMAIAGGLAQNLHVGKAIGEPGVEREKFDGAAGGRDDAAGGHDLHSDVDDDRAGMEEIERPHVHGAACKIDTAGGVGLYSPEQITARSPGKIC